MQPSTRSRLRRPPARAAFALLLVVATAQAAQAATLPPAPVMGHAPEYVIVTPSAFAAEFQKLAYWKTHSGVPGYVKTLESIQAEYPSGRDPAERVRLFLKDAKAQWGTRWVLLGGDAPWMPARRVHTAFYGGLDFVSDLYFSGLEGSWDANGNGTFGEGYSSASAPGDSADLTPDVYVGRAPVRSIDEARAFVNKTRAASFLPLVPRPHRLLLAADVLFPGDWSPGQPISFDGAETLEPVALWASTVPGIQIRRLYENWNDPRWPGATPIGRAALLTAIREGADLCAISTFGGPMVIAAGPDTAGAADFAALTDAARLTNGWILDGQTGNFEGDCLASNWVRSATGGAVTCVAPSSYNFPTAQRPYVDEFARLIYVAGVTAVGEASARSKLPFIPFSTYDGVNRMTQMETNLIGDPETRILTAPSAPLAVTAPAAVPVGGTGFEVNVAFGGTPVAGARVIVLFGEEALGLAATDENGTAWVAFSGPRAGAAEIVVTASDGGQFSGSIAVVEALAVGPGAAPGARLELPSPNPASVAARLSGRLEAAGRLEFFDTGGRRVRAFALAPGRFEVSWDLKDESGRPLQAGLYFSRLAWSGGAVVRRVAISP